MARRERPAHDEARRQRQEQQAQDVQDLPNREAMSILSGLPTLPGLPPGLLSDQTGAPAPGAPSAQPVDPGASPGDTNTIAPLNQASVTNFNSSGTTEAIGAAQDVPITQH